MVGRFQRPVESTQQKLTAPFPTVRWRWRGKLFLAGHSHVLADPLQLVGDSRVDARGVPPGAATPILDHAHQDGLLDALPLVEDGPPDGAVGIPLARVLGTNVPLAANVVAQLLEFESTAPPPPVQLMCGGMLDW